MKLTSNPQMNGRKRSDWDRNLRSSWSWAQWLHAGQQSTQLYTYFSRLAHLCTSHSFHKTIQMICSIDNNMVSKFSWGYQFFSRERLAWGLAFIVASRFGSAQDKMSIFGSAHAGCLFQEPLVNDWKTQDGSAVIFGSGIYIFLVWYVWQYTTEHSCVLWQMPNPKIDWFCPEAATTLCYQRNVSDFCSRFNPISYLHVFRKKKLVSYLKLIWVWTLSHDFVNHELFVLADVGL